MLCVALLFELSTASCLKIITLLPEASGKSGSFAGWLLCSGFVRLQMCMICSTAKFKALNSVLVLY